MRMKNGIYHDQGTDTLFGMLYAYFRKITLKCRKGCEALIVVLSSSCFFFMFHLDRQLRRKLSYRLRVFVKVGLPNFRKSPRSYIWILWNIGQMKFSLKFVNNHSAADVNAFVKLEMDRLTND